MTFREGARMDAGRVRTGGGGRGGKLALGGGAGGLIVIILALLFGGDPSSLLGSGVPDTSADPQAESALEQCEIGGSAANENVDCRVLYTVGSLDSVWEQQFATQTGVAYVQPEVEIFTSATSTGCGNATSDIGPFYCPADQTAYFDTSFFDELETRFGASGGPLAQEYVVAHEFGHHLQNQLGDLGRAQATRAAPNPAPSVRNCRPTATPGCGPTTPTSCPSRPPESPSSCRSPTPTSATRCRPHRPSATTGSSGPPPVG